MKLYFILTSEKTSDEVLAFSDFIRAEHACGKGRDYLVVTDSSKLCAVCTELGIPAAGVMQAEEIFFEQEFEFGTFPGAEYLIVEPEEVEDAEYYRIWKRLRGESLIVGETKRCILRESETRDADALASIFASVQEGTHTKVPFKSTEEGIEFLKDYIGNQYKIFGFGNWSVIEKKTGKVIGWAGISLWEEGPRDENGEYNLSYVIAPGCRGQGIASEVCTEILRMGFEKYDIDRICVRVADGNAASLGVCDKLHRNVPYPCEKRSANHKTEYRFEKE